MQQILVEEELEYRLVGHAQPLIYRGTLIGLQDELKILIGHTNWFWWIEQRPIDGAWQPLQPTLSERIKFYLTQMGFIEIMNEFGEDDEMYQVPTDIIAPEMHASQLQLTLDQLPEDFIMFLRAYDLVTENCLTIITDPSVGYRFTSIFAPVCRRVVTMWFDNIVILVCDCSEEEK